MVERKPRHTAAALCVTLLLCLASPSLVLSHHGLATFDIDRPITLAGTVTDFRFANPHVHLNVDVKNAQGTVVNWSLEGSGVYYWNRAGWTATSLKRGDQVTVTVAPTKSGTPVGLLLKIALANGRELSMER